MWGSGRQFSAVAQTPSNSAASLPRPLSAIELFGLVQLSLFADGTGEVVDVVGVIGMIGDSTLEFLAGGGVIPRFVIGQSRAVHQKRAHGVAPRDEANGQEQSESAWLSGVETHRNPPSVSVVGNLAGSELWSESEASWHTADETAGAAEAAKVSFWPNLPQAHNRSIAVGFSVSRSFGVTGPLVLADRVE